MSLPANTLTLASTDIPIWKLYDSEGQYSSAWVDATLIDPAKKSIDIVTSLVQGTWNLTHGIAQFMGFPLNAAAGTAAIQTLIPETPKTDIQTILQEHEAKITGKPNHSNRVISSSLCLPNGEILNCHRLETSFIQGGEKRAHFMAMEDTVQKIHFFVFLDSVFAEKIEVAIEKQAIEANIALPALFIEERAMIVPLAEDGVTYVRKLKTEKERIVFALQFLDLCIRARKAGICHGDIKLDNTLVKDGQLYLCDFGSATTRKTVSMWGRGTATNLPFILKKPGFSRESAIPTDHVDNHAIGCSLYQIMTRQYHTYTESDLDLDSYHTGLREIIKKIPIRMEKSSPIAKQIFALIPDLCTENFTALPIEELQTRVEIIKQLQSTH